MENLLTGKVFGVIGSGKLILIEDLQSARSSARLFTYVIIFSVYCKDMRYELQFSFRK